ncbi:conserved hypothetical protein [Alkaliphilus metalliredigens QYMF]|uniref:Uncharacterized protein n=1 Tax=Alkaliphilus metalliredigens (strain QYMF) TaxID=293826 RepID=A6TRH6_ALKMQ|nr:sulfide/dihydroorotate dehydrogenase-like FAD/NAD-binding protein [Alkaliphilus metalliredigens]ABR48794.1 conserved hypothetical protein [Alkaliphilus metalliredigens QYMF]
MTVKYWECIDAGSDYCPCYLAESNDCITCTHLQNKNYCDCNWRGVCIYQEFKFLNEQRKSTRIPHEVAIVSRVDITPNLKVFKLKVNDYLIRHLKQPGAYIFVRNKSKDQYFDIPISIMNVESASGLIDIAIEIHGVKTKSLKDDSESLLIKAPYWNGIIGIQHLKSLAGGRCLIVARGIAQAPAVLLIQHLRQHNNTVDVILDTGSIKHDFISHYTDANLISTVDLYSEQGKSVIQQAIAKHEYQLSFIGGSDYLQKQILEVSNFHNINLVTTNNHHMCCGEGICGACTIYDIAGNAIKTCKSQLVHH